MKKMRKGFTLVELLIVIAILGTLAAIMASSTGDATVRAKVSQIVGNIEACKLAATVYYADHFDDATMKMSEKSAADVLAANIPTYKDFEDGNIKIKADTTNGRENWAITVDFTNDADRTKLAELLKKTRGYSGNYTTTDNTDPENPVTNTTDFVTDGKFKVNLTTGLMSKAD